MIDNDALEHELDVELRNLLLPYLRNREDENQFPKELLSKFIDKYNIFSSCVDSQLDGSTVPFLTLIRLIAKYFPAFSTILLTQAYYGIYPFMRFGTIDQQSHYLESLVKGERLVGLGFSEGKSMESLSVIETTAAKTATGWRLSGEKSIVSNCRFADILLILAKIEADGEKDSFGFFIVDTRDPGVVIGDDISKPGLKGLPISSVAFDNVLLTQDRLLGLSLSGAEQLNDILQKLQLGLSAVSLGVAEGAFEKGLSFVKVKRGFGKRLLDATVYQYQFADLYTKLCSAKAYFNSYQDNMRDALLFVCQIKLYTTKVALEISEDIIRLMSPLHTVEDIPIDRYLKDAKTLEMYGKSGDSIRKRIACQWLKE